MRDFDKIGDYEVVGRIGQGSFGVVYLGRDPYLKREVAIKICSVNDRELRQRFYREAEIAGKLQHENIVTVFSFGLEGELPYLVQEYLAGEDLDAIIKRGDDVAPAQKLDWLRQIARGLAYAHKHGIIHRDIKPGNVRILPEGQVKIMDFGIAKLASAETQLTQKGVTMGSASYLPPEQVQAEELDQRADIFSFGVLAYELLSGQRPFRGNTLSAVVYQILYKVPAPLTASWPACPQPLADLVARCLEKRPQKRYPNFGSLMPELEAVRESLARGPAGAAAGRPAGAAASRSAGRPAPRPAEQPGTSPEATQPVPLVDAGGEASPPAPPVEVGQATVRLEEGSDLGNRALEIARLVERGELDRAMRELEDTYHRQRDATPKPAVSSTEGTVRLADAAAPSARPPERRVAAAAAPAWKAALRSAAGLLRAAAGAVEVAAARLAPLAARARSVLGSVRGGWRGWPRPALFAAGGVALLAFLILGLRLGLGADGIEPVPPPSLPPPPVEVPETAPVELPTGEVRIDAVPWGELMEIAAADGVLQPLPDGGQAPLRFRLPTGRYRISLHHPEAASPVPCEVEVTAGGVARCDAVLYEPDALTYFKAVGWWQ